IYVKKGKKVKEGDKLLILEAMKMKNDIVSPVNGTIKKINVKEGSRVTKKDILIELI
ncbi:MAG: biotin/lipoyl-binding protein, partial [Bacteroidales bacterium]|nr:biotin/lipoyl-binding protein [Bacteroidales bacterium]